MHSDADGLVGVGLRRRQRMCAHEQGGERGPQGCFHGTSFHGGLTASGGGSCMSAVALRLDCYGDNVAIHRLHMRGVEDQPHNWLGRGFERGDCDERASPPRCRRH
jgi:hypothetical protein